MFLILYIICPFTVKHNNNNNNNNIAAEERAWYVDIVVREGKVTFKLDTEAEVTAVSKGMYLQQAAKCSSTQHAPAHTLLALEEALEHFGPVLDGICLQRSVRQPTDVCGGRLEIQSPRTPCNQSPQPSCKTG